MSSGEGPRAPQAGPAARAFTRVKAAEARRRAAFDRAARDAALAALGRAVRAHEGEILAALAADLGKPAVETRLTEILPVLAEIRHARRHLRSWMRLRRVRPTLAMLGTRAAIRPEPKGTALIIAPWNYPISLALGPLVSALAAGCGAVVKPSELAPASSALIARIVAAALPGDLVQVAEGGVETATDLLAQRFDHIFFTGSPAVGRVVMAAAAQTLASVTLELGGKSPVVIGPGADMRRAARMVAWGKFANAGQTCIAPDHVFVPRTSQDRFLAELERQIGKMYGRRPIASASLARIVNARHFARLKGLIEGALAGGATLAQGGAMEDESLRIAPTVLLRTDAGMAIAREEIFGPVLPVIAYDDLDPVLDQIAAGETPLALYVFERDRAVIERVIGAVSSGTVGINVTLVQYLHLNLPFGGIGNSGLGAAHGLWGFRAFSHERPVIEDRFSALGMLMPPYDAAKARLARLVARLVG
ncbi:MAG: aldehyde dehydrogenase family protein [Sphingomonadales bacterium]|nr:aldehyde dehydrogenase family protein [Sphingomonadales bacterium]